MTHSGYGSPLTGITSHVLHTQTSSLNEGGTATMFVSGATARIKKRDIAAE